MLIPAAGASQTGTGGPLRLASSLSLFNAGSVPLAIFDIFLATPDTNLVVNLTASVIPPLREVHVADVLNNMRSVRAGGVVLSFGLCRPCARALQFMV